MVAATGATGLVIHREVVAAALTERAGRPLVLLDLALPRDVEPDVRSLPGVTLIDLESLQATLSGTGAGEDVEAAKEIVAEEVTAFLTWQVSSRIAPTVVALRSKADAVVEAELSRLAQQAARPAGARARRGRAGDPPGRPDPAAHPDRAGEGADRGAGRAVLRRRPARALRARPALPRPP